MRHATHTLRSALQAASGFLLLFALVGSTTTATAQSISLPITFEESINYGLRDFEPGGVDGPTSTIIVDPTDATNMVVQTVRPATAVCYAGTTVAEGVGFDQAIPFTMDATTMSVRVWSPEAGALVLFKVEEQGNPGLFVETFTYTTVAGGWETMVFDFADPKPNGAPIQIGARPTPLAQGGMRRRISHWTRSAPASPTSSAARVSPAAGRRNPQDRNSRSDSSRGIADDNPQRSRRAARRGFRW